MIAYLKRKKTQGLYMKMKKSSQ